MNTVLLGIIIYFMLQLAIGVFASRKIKSEGDYFLAGRQLGVPLAGLSIFATWFGAETCMGSAGAIFEDGLSGGRADPFGYSVCLFLLAFLLSTRLWKRNLVTLADLFRERFSTTVEQVAVWIMVPSSLIWAAAQVRAFGQIISVVMPIDVFLATSVGALVIIGYTVLGGLLGDVITDFFQGIILIGGLVLLFFMTTSSLGGIVPALSGIEPERLSFVAGGESWLAALDSWCVPILGSLVAQELISRVLASRSAKVAKRASIFAAVLYLTVGLVPVMLGLVGPKLVGDIAHGDLYLPTLAQKLLPNALFVVFAGALLSAILSTVDSTLLAVSALVSHNVVTPLLGDKVTEKRKVTWARIVVFLGGLFSYIMAMYADSIYSLVESASTFGTAGILIITLFALWGNFGSQQAALVALVFGVVTTPVAEYVLELEAPFVTAIGMSLLGFVGYELAASGYRNSAFAWIRSKDT